MPSTPSSGTVSRNWCSHNKKFHCSSTLLKSSFKSLGMFCIRRVPNFPSFLEESFKYASVIALQEEIKCPVCLRLPRKSPVYQVRTWHQSIFQRRIVFFIAIEFWKCMHLCTPQIVYKVAICPRGNLPYIQITSRVLPYSQSTNYLLGTNLSWRKSTLYPDRLYSATLYPVTL